MVELHCACVSRNHTPVKQARDVLAGVRGFGQGLLARTLTIAPGAAIQWYIYENVKAKLANVPC